MKEQLVWFAIASAGVWGCGSFEPLGVPEGPAHDSGSFDAGDSSMPTDGDATVVDTDAGAPDASDSCSDAGCVHPPGPLCNDDGTASRVYEATGRCVSGACSYAFSETPCYAGCEQGVCRVSPWPMFLQNHLHTGRSALVGPQTATKKWSVDLGGSIESSPVVDGDGTIYLPTYQGILHALKADGTSKWTLDLREVESPPVNPPRITGTPAIGPDGTVYVGNQDRGLFAISREGKVNWIFRLSVGVYGSAIVAPDSTIYVGSLNHKFYAVTPTGEQKWRFQTDLPIKSSPALAPDGTVYFTSLDGFLYAVNPDGSQKWKVNLGDQSQSSPSIGKDGTLYVGNASGSVFAIDSTGTKKWSYYTGFAVLASPTIAEDGTVYVGSYTGHMIALDGTTGEVKFSMMPTAEHSFIDSSVAIDSTGTLFFGYGPSLIAMTPAGSVLWRFDTKGPVLSSPAIGPGGLIYFGSTDGQLYVVGP